jgi:hypothetical protein
MTDYIKNQAMSAGKAISSGAKTLKEKVIGRPKKMATVVDDDDDKDEDPCHYEELGDKNLDKDPLK